MANYAIMRIEKRKLGAVGRICNHHERLKAEYKSNPDIDPSRTHLNYHIVEPTAKYRKAVLDRIEEVGAKRRKDSVVMQDCFVGGTPDWLKGKSVEEQRKYFDYAYRFFENNFKKENIISAVVHLDEATPHMHLCFVPITDKGRLSSKDIIGGPKGLVGWQDKFYEYMHEKYTDITRGTPAKVSHRKHIPPFMLIDSIKESGVLIPIVVRPKGKEYEILSGHRRIYACKMAGINKVPAIIRELSRDEAVIFMVDSNLHREGLLPSEKGFAYKMKLEAMKHQGRTSAQVGQKLTSVQALADSSSDSKTQVQRYIRLTFLEKPLLDLVDEGRIALTPAVELSYLLPEEQRNLIETIESEDCTPSLSQSVRMRKLSNDGLLTMDLRS